jgi:hypothetical protein
MIPFWVQFLIGYLIIGLIHTEADIKVYDLSSETPYSEVPLAERSLARAVGLVSWPYDLLIKIFIRISFV